MADTDFVLGFKEDIINPVLAHNYTLYIVRDMIWVTHNFRSMLWILLIDHNGGFDLYQDSLDFYLKDMVFLYHDLDSCFEVRWSLMFGSN